MRPGSSAAVLLSYDVPHQVPWGWPVSLYTWTKGIASGCVLVTVVLVLAGKASWTDPVARFWMPGVALAFLGLTGALLVADLTHPTRCYLIFTRPQWRSWLVKGALVLLAFGAAVAGYLLAATIDSVTTQKILAPVAAGLALCTACYTAYLFAQARGRDLWQSRLLAPELACQAVLAGSAFLLPVVEAVGPRPARSALELILAVASALHLLLVFAEIARTHPTEQARVAIAELTRGKLAWWFWAGVAGVALGLGAPFFGVVVVPFALLGLLAYEHAYVQAGQCVPLA